MVSAVMVSVTISGAPVAANSSPTRTAACRSSAPTTTRSGWRLSWTAVPSRRNSGLETTVMSSRPVTCSTSVAVPTGTVDLLTTTAPGTRAAAISSAAASTWERSAEPSSPWGVGTQRKTNSAPAAASAAEATKRRRAAPDALAAPARPGPPPRWAPRRGADVPSRAASRSATPPGGRSAPGRRRSAAPRSRRRPRPPCGAPAAPTGPGVAHAAPGRRSLASPPPPRRPTSRPRPSCQSGRSGRPARRRAALSSTELAGRGAGRGGSRSAVAIGSHPAGVGRRPPAPPARSRTRWSAPWLVTW